MVFAKGAFFGGTFTSDACKLLASWGHMCHSVRKEGKNMFLLVSHSPPSPPTLLPPSIPLACAVSSTVSTKPAQAWQNGPSFFCKARFGVSFLSAHTLIYTPSSWLTDCPITHHLTSMSPGHSLSPLHSYLSPLVALKATFSKRETIMRNNVFLKREWLSLKSIGLCDNKNCHCLAWNMCPRDWEEQRDP